MVLEHSALTVPATAGVESCIRLGDQCFVEAINRISQLDTRRFIINQEIPTR